jgi:hypothetical protein
MALVASPNGTYGTGGFESIASYTFASAASSYTFTSIPQTFTDLRLVINSISSTDNFPQLRFGNGSVDTGANYDRQMFSGNGSTAVAFAESNLTGILCNYNEMAGANYKYMQISDIFQYASSKYKTVVTQVGNAANGVGINACTWKSTSAIDTLQCLLNSGNYAIGATLSLYGRKAS